LREAAEQRRRAPAPRVLKAAILVFGAVGLILVLSLIFHRAGRSPIYNFASQRGAVTVMSAILLSMSAAFAFAAASFSRSRHASHVEAWMLFAAGLVFLAADEILQFNMWFGQQLEVQLSLPHFVRGDDLVVIGYGIAAALIGLLSLPALVSTPRVGRFLFLGFGFYLLHTLLDVFGHGWRVAVVYEESAKVLAGACLLLATYVGLMSFAPSAPDAAPPGA